MMKAFFILFFLCSAFGLNAQTPQPAGFPITTSTGWIRYGYLQSDSGNIAAVRDTNFVARFIGTVVYKIRAGVDSVFYISNGKTTGKKWDRMIGVIPQQFNPIAGTNVTLSGTYPNITFNATSSGGTVTSFSKTDGYGIISSVTNPTTTPNYTARVDTSKVTTQHYVDSSVSVNKGWSLTGNAGTNPTVNFLGTTDNQPVVIKTNNNEAGYFGFSGALSKNYFLSPLLAVGDLSNTAFVTTTVSTTPKIYNLAPYNDSISGSANITTSVNGVYAGGDGNITLPSSSIPTWQQTLVAGSSLDQDNTIQGNNNNLQFIDPKLFYVQSLSSGSNPFGELTVGLNGASIKGTDGSHTHISTIAANGDSIKLTPYIGKIYIDSLAVGSTTDSVVVYNKTTKKIGYKAFPAGAAYTDSVRRVLTSKGLLMGNSTVATFSCGIGVENFLMSTADSALGTTIFNQAVAGNSIAQQQAVYLADANKATYDWIIIEVGLNNVDSLTVSDIATVMAAYQHLVDTINATKKATATIILSAMTPAKQRWIDLYGAAGGARAQTMWSAMNNAIMGGQPYKITGVNYRVNNHVSYLSDAFGNLAPQFNCGDNIHENNYARAIIAAGWRQTLNGIGYLTDQIPTPIYPNNADTGAVNTIPVFNATNSLAGKPALQYVSNALRAWGSIRSVEAAVNGNYSEFLHQDIVGLTAYPSANFFIGNPAFTPIQSSFIIAPAYNSSVSKSIFILSNYPTVTTGGTKQVYLYNDGVSASLFTTTASATGDAMDITFGGLGASDARMTIKTDGKTGIGTILPLQKLDVVGNSKYSGYSINPPNYATPTTGSTFTTTQTTNIIDPAGTLLALTIALPSSPVDGQLAYYSFSQIITNLSFSGGTLANNVTTASAGSFLHLQYSSTASKWFIQ